MTGFSLFCIGFCVGVLVCAAINRIYIGKLNRLVDKIIDELNKE